MKRLTLLFTASVLLMLSAAPLYAQNKELSTMDMLMNRVWEREKYKIVNMGPGQQAYLERYDTFDETQWTTCIIENKTNVLGIADTYYLSDEIEEVFDKSKVGKVKNGKYIIADFESGARAFEILKITDKELVLDILGDIIGKGQLRYFKTDKKLWQDPKTGKDLTSPKAGEWVSYDIE